MKDKMGIINKKDLLYILFIFVLVFLTFMILSYYDVYLFGTPAQVYVFIENDCKLCPKFINFTETFLKENGYKVNLCFLDSNNQSSCFEAYKYLRETGLPYIVPTTVVFREEKPRGIVLGDWYATSFWEVLRDTKLNGTSIIPVFKWGDLIGYIKINTCIFNNFYKAFQQNRFNMLNQQCNTKPIYIYLGAYGYGVPNFP